MKTTNVEESKKIDKLELQEQHLYRAERERLVYKRECKNAKTHLEEVMEHNIGCDDESKFRTIDFTHLSFDFAQQLHFPAPPDQPGGLFFLTPRKCGLFGICNEAQFQQANYLIDESVTIGKGPNCIISLLHHYLETRVLLVKLLNLHCR